MDAAGVRDRVGEAQPGLKTRSRSALALWIELERVLPAVTEVVEGPVRAIALPDFRTYLAGRGATSAGR